MSRKWMMWAGCGLMVAVGAYLLWSRGFQNVMSYAVLLLCPLMHIFMMRGHDHGSGHDHDHEAQTQQEAEKRPACH